MRIIGICGGSSLCELGSASDVQLFFDCVEKFVVLRFPEQNWKILTDKLYRRYLREDELEIAEVMMTQVKQVFKNLSNSSVDWSRMTATAETCLNPSESTLAEIFNKFFESFSYCKESAEVFFNSWNIYQPVRIVIADMPDFLTDKKRPLEQYDLLEGQPFWLC